MSTKTMALIWQRPRSRKTDFGKERKWMAPCYMITQTGTFPFLCFAYIGGIVPGFTKIGEKRTLAAAQRYCQEHSDEGR